MGTERSLATRTLSVKSQYFSSTIQEMDSKKLDLNLLATLEALLVERNVTKAAARLHLSQPAVSAQLNRLRLLFDDPLLIPAHRGMTPTAKAIELLGPVREALNQLRSTLASHGDFDPAQARMTLSIACTDYLQAVAVIPLVKALRPLAPGIRVGICHLSPELLAAQMERGDVDLALMSPEIAPPNLHTRHLCDERYVLIGRRDHPRLSDAVTLAEYASFEHVVVSLSGGGFVTPVDEVLARFGYTRNVVLSAASFLLVPEIIAQSDFVALVPERLVRAQTDRLKLVSVFPPVEDFTVSMVWHERNHGHPGHRWLREMMKSLFSEP